MERAVFLDRDGVVNHMVYDEEHGLVDSPSNPDQLRLVPGAAGSIRRLQEGGFLVIVVSNQPGVAKGKLTRALLDATTGRMLHLLEQEGARPHAIYYCLHHPEAAKEEYRARCDCRKPGPGLLLRAAGEWGVDMGRSFMVGDGVVDVLAGNRAGCRAILIAPEKLYVREVLERKGARPEYITPSLEDAVEIMLGTVERDAPPRVPHHPPKYTLVPDLE